MTVSDDELSFTVVDEVVHLLDTPAEPWSIEVELAVDGQLEEGRLRAAIAVALDHHVMARVHLRPSRLADRQHFWQVTPAAELDALHVVDCDDDADVGEVRDRLQSISVPLAESPPLRLRLVHGGDGDRLMLNANHAAFDGFGCLRLLHSVARAYSGQPDPPPTTSLAEARDVKSHLGTADAQVRARRLRVIADKALDIVRAPARIAADGGVDRPGYVIVHHSLSPQQTKLLTASERHATVNDVLVAALHLAISEWNLAHHRRAQRISVLMPVNLRPEPWRQDIVTNFVLMTRTVTKPAQQRSPGAALAAIGAQTERIKDRGLGAALIELLGRASHLPLWAKQSLSPLLWLSGNRLVDTALMSNLGQLDPPEFGPDAGTTTGLWFSAPARMPCGVSVGAAAANGGLHLSFRCRHPVFDRPAADRFADCYLACLSQLLR